MESSKELLKVQIKMQSYFSKVEALADALDTRQKDIYKETLRCNKEKYIKRHSEELDEELLQLVDRLFQ